MFLLKLTRMLGTIYCLCIVINNHLSGGVVSGFSDVCSFIGKFPSFRGGPHSSVTYGKVPHTCRARAPNTCPLPPAAPHPLPHTDGTIFQPNLHHQILSPLTPNLAQKLETWVRSCAVHIYRVDKRSIHPVYSCLFFSLPI